MCLPVSDSICIRGLRSRMGRAASSRGLDVTPWCAATAASRHSPALHRDPGGAGASGGLCSLSSFPGVAGECSDKLISPVLPVCQLVPYRSGSPMLVPLYHFCLHVSFIWYQKFPVLPYYTFEIAYLTTAFPSDTKIMKFIIYLF